MGDSLVFVSVDSKDGKVTNGDRLRIRQRCMQGKNKKPNSRRSLIASQKATHSEEVAEIWQVEGPGANGLEKKTFQGEGHPRHGHSAELAHRNKQSETRRPYYIDERYNPELDTELIRFLHQDSAIYPRDFINVFHRFKEVKGMNGPLLNLLHFDDMEETDARFLIIQDAPFNQAMKLAISAFNDLSQQTGVSTRTHSHHQKTVSLLNARISGAPEHFLIDTTIYIINTLAVIAVWTGRHAEIAAHVAALKHIIRRRGGRSFLFGRQFVRHQMQALDLANFMFSGNIPNLGEFENGNGAFVISSAVSLPESINRLVDSRLCAIYLDFQETTARINTHIARGELLQFSEFQPMYGSILYRLSSLECCLEDATSECFRLGLLAFLLITSIRVPNTESTRLNRARQFAYLTRSYRTSCQNLKLDTPRLSSLAFWLLTIGIMSVFNVDEEDWLVIAWSEVSKTLPGARLSWESAKSYLESILWIPSTHDVVGKEAYETLMVRGTTPKS